jgi:hypothetical protein
MNDLLVLLSFSTGAQHLSTKHEMPADKVTWTSSENADPATA